MVGDVSCGMYSGVQSESGGELPRTSQVYTSNCVWSKQLGVKQFFLFSPLLTVEV